MKEPLKILIKYPSRERPDLFKPTLTKYVNMADDKINTTIIPTLDGNDHTMYNLGMLNYIESFYPTVETRIGFAYTVSIYGKSKGKIDAVNRDMKTIIQLIDWDICLLASDDMIPQIQGYDNFIREKFNMIYPDLDGALFLNDGKTFDKLNTIVCVGRKYFDRFGYLYHPSYHSLWCDNESTEVGQALGLMTYIPDIIIKNESPDWGGTISNDALYQRNNKYYYIDKKNYERRKKAGFPA